MSVKRAQFSDGLRKAIVKAYHGVCQYCDAVEANIIEHIVPLAKGGTNDLENLTLSCKRCNSKKAALVLPETYSAILIARAVAKVESIKRMSSAAASTNHWGKNSEYHGRSWAMIKGDYSTEELACLRHVYAVLHHETTRFAYTETRCYMNVLPSVWYFPRSPGHRVPRDIIHASQGFYTARGWVNSTSVHLVKAPPYRYEDVDDFNRVTVFLSPALVWLFNQHTMTEAIHLLTECAIVDVKTCARLIRYLPQGFEGFEV